MTALERLLSGWDAGEVITRLNTVTVCVSGQERSVDFYVGVLGFEKRADR